MQAVGSTADTQRQLHQLVDCSANLQTQHTGTLETRQDRVCYLADVSVCVV